MQLPGRLSGEQASRQVLERTATTPGGGRVLSVVGHSVPRVDALEKVTGAGAYVADIRLPGLLEGRVLRSPHPHARLLRVDATRARAHTGVYAAVTGRETPGIRWGEFRKDLHPLAIDRVRYVGDEIAAVAATDAETAEAALALIDVEYEELPPVFDVEAALAPGAPVLHEELGSNVVHALAVHRGDPDAAFAVADLVLEDTFVSRVQWHASLEPTGAVAQVDADGVLTVWMNANGVAPMRDLLAEALGLPTRKVRVIQPLVGGSFGGRGHDNNAFVCALLALAARRPVRLVNSREENFLATRPREPMTIHMRLGCQWDGTVIAKETHVLADNGAYSTLGPPVARTATLRPDHLLRNTSIRADLQVVHTNTVPRGAFRGFGSPSGQWALQQMLDEIARALELDPRDVLLRNLVEAGHTSPHGARLLSCEVKACVQKVAKLIAWDAKRASRVPNRGLGIAVSCMVSGRRSHADFDGSPTVVQLELDGLVQVRSGEGETGPGTRTVLAQIAAEELGARYEDVRVTPADTATTPFGFGAHGSRATYVAGNSVRVAARRARDEILQVAAELLEVAPEDLEIAESRVSVQGAPGRGRALSLAEVARRGLFRRDGRQITTNGSWDPPSELPDRAEYGNESGAYNFCAGALEVEVDPATGAFSILDAAVASDAGTVINPVACEGQVEGAFAQGLGFAFIEDLVVEAGRPLNPNFSDYRLPTVADMPPFRHAFVPSYEPTGPFGAKGIAQVGLDPVAPALANAICDAVGVRIKTLPITPEKVFWALRERGS